MIFLILLNDSVARKLAAPELQKVSIRTCLAPVFSMSCVIF